MLQLCRLTAFIRKQRRLIARRDGLRRHLELEYRFWKIGRDKYVRMSRDKKEWHV